MSLPTPDLSYRLTLRRDTDPEERLSLGDVTEYLSDQHVVLGVGYLLEANRAQLLSGRYTEGWRGAFQPGNVPVRRLTYGSPIQVVLDIAPYGAPFLAAYGTLRLWRLVNDTRRHHAATNFVVESFKVATRELESDDIDKNYTNIEHAIELLAETDQVELTEERQVQNP